MSVIELLHELKKLIDDRKLAKGFTQDVMRILKMHDTLINFLK